MNLKKDNRGIAKSALVLIIVLVIGLVAGGAIFAKNMFMSDPMTKLITGYINTYSQREMKYSTELTFSLDKNNAEAKKAFGQIPAGLLKSDSDQLMDFVSKILPKLSIEYSAIANTKEDPVSIGANMSILYDNKELLDGGVTARPWEASIYSKTLLSKPLYSNFTDTVKAASGLDITSIKLKDYLDVLYEQDDFTKNFASSKYAEILKEKFKDNLKSEGMDKVVLTMNYADSIKLFEDILKEGAKDEALKTSVLNKLDKIIAVAVKNGDYKLVGLSEEDFKKQAEEGKKQLSENWDKILTDMVQVYSGEEFKQYLATTGNMPIKYIFTFSGDSISKIDGETSVQGITIKFNTTVDKYSTDGFTFADASNSDDLTTALNGYGLMGTVMGKANEILTGDAFKTMKEDLIKTAKESLAAEDAAIIETNLNQLSALSGMSGN
jgi:hypothetical protein